MSRENLIALLGSLGERIDADMTLDAEDHTLLQVDGRIDLAISFDEDTRSVLMVAKCGHLPTGNLQSLLLEVLAANFHWAGTGGATLAVDPHERTLHLQFREPTDQLDEDRLQLLLAAIVQNARKWADRLETGHWTGEPSFETEAPGGNALDAMSGFPSVSMIRI
ncbi:MAG: type III secretion system chaperone [Candidatus Methylacidiphilales bacterium]|nr:type III secretion system chaperone [Candidatus Methylacidiphilales bacterium]